MLLYEAIVRVQVRNLTDLKFQLKSDLDRIKATGLNPSTEDILTTLMEQVEFELDKLDNQ